MRAWQPEGFDAVYRHFPETPRLGVPRDVTAEFARRWHAWPKLSAAERRARVDPAVALVLVRGYLGDWMPGSFGAALGGARRLGLDARRVRDHARRRIEENAAHLARRLERLAPRRFVLLAHSRGGLVALLSLASAPGLAERCAGVILSQTPRGPSRVLQGLLFGRSRRTGERAQALGLALLGARRSGRELADGSLGRLVAAAERVAGRVPVLQTASWSTRPTTWLDSFHHRLGEIRPGCAHDGQFYLEDLVWPDVPHVLLPELDHAQPVMGGRGFDPARYWLALRWLLRDGAAA